MKTSMLAVLLALAATASIGSCDVLDVAESVPELSSLVAAIKAAGLEEAAANLTIGTVLAPTNDAFEALFTVLQDITGLPITSLADIPTDALAETLTYHILPIPYTAAYLAKLAPAVLPTLLANATLTVSLAGDTVGFIPSSGFSPANVTQADIVVKGTDVIIHLINNVLIPTEALL